MAGEQDDPGAGEGPSIGDKAKTVAGDAAKDVGKVALAAAQGAAQGAAVGAVSGPGAAATAAAGAAKSAAWAALQSKTGRRIIIAAIAIALVLVLVGIAGIVTSAMLATAAMATADQLAAAASSEQPEEAIQSSMDEGESASVPWEILLAAQQSIGDAEPSWSGSELAAALSDLDPERLHRDLRAGLIPMVTSGHYRPPTEADPGYDELTEEHEQVRETYVQALVEIGLSEPEAEDAWTTAQTWVRGTQLGCPESATPAEQSQTQSGESIDEAQATNAQIIIGIAKTMFPDDWEHAALTALVVAYTESRLRVLANDGVYGDHDYEITREAEYPQELYPVVATSMDLPNQGFGSQYLALGMFQQMMTGSWGTAGDSTFETDPEGVVGRLMTAEWSTYAFLTRAQAVDGWAQMDPAALGEVVQVSGNGSATARNLPAAQELFEQYRDAPAIELPDGAVAAAPSRDDTQQIARCELDGTGTVNPGSVDAPSDDFPYADHARYPRSALSPLGYYYGQCVDFAAWRFNRDGGSTSEPWAWTWGDITPGGGNAAEWIPRWEQNHGVPVSDTPTAGWLFVVPAYASGALETGSAGHIGYVQQVNPDGSIFVEDYNHEGDTSYHAYVLTEAQYQSSNIVFLPMLYDVEGTGFSRVG